MRPIRRLLVAAMLMVALAAVSTANAAPSFYCGFNLDRVLPNAVYGPINNSGGGCFPYANTDAATSPCLLTVAALKSKLLSESKSIEGPNTLQAGSP
jgi:hypothetical protein